MNSHTSGGPLTSARQGEFRELSTIKNLATSRAGLLTAATAVTAAATAAWVESQARRAEREHPSTGRFVDIDGVRLHYVERGEGPPVVLTQKTVF